MRRYEVVHVQSLLAMLQDAARQSLGPEVRIDPAHLTCLLVVIMLLTGSDYSRGIAAHRPAQALGRTARRDSGADHELGL